MRCSQEMSLRFSCNLRSRKVNYKFEVDKKKKQQTDSKDSRSNIEKKV